MASASADHNLSTIIVTDLSEPILGTVDFEKRKNGVDASNESLVTDHTFLVRLSQLIQKFYRRVLKILLDIFVPYRKILDIFFYFSIRVPEWPKTWFFFLFLFFSK